jgi:hypothetical protein
MVRLRAAPYTRPKTGGGETAHAHQLDGVAGDEHQGSLLLQRSISP